MIGSLHVALAALGAAIGVGMIGSAASTAVGRNPGASTKIMVQAILAIAFAEAGHALRIDFLPHERRKVAIPDGLAFVVAYSGEEAPKGGTKARDAYLRLLRSGGSKYPIDLLREAGVDMTTSRPFDAAMAEMNAIMDQMEKILARQGKGKGAKR